MLVVLGPRNVSVPKLFAAVCVAAVLSPLLFLPSCGGAWITGAGHRPPEPGTAVAARGLATSSTGGADSEHHPDTPTPVQVPAPPMLLGLVVLHGWARRLRSRIKNVAPTQNSYYDS